MIRKLSLKALASGALAVSGLLAGIQTAEAGPVRLAFDPAYGAPFSELAWRGEAIVDDGDCTSSGTVSNFFGGCSGDFTFTSAKVELYRTSDNASLQTMLFTGAAVARVERSDLSTAGAVYSSPFNPVQGDGDIESKYFGMSAFFSLIFVGEYAQLYWFNYDPGNPLVDPWMFPYVNFASLPSYLGCYLAGPGDNKISRRKHCGLSEGKGAKLTITSAVPEPSSHALALAALGVLALSFRRRSRNQPRVA